MSVTPLTYTMTERGWRRRSKVGVSVPADRPYLYETKELAEAASINKELWDEPILIEIITTVETRILSELPREGD